MRPASGPTPSYRSRPTPWYEWCWAACAGLTCGTTGASRRTRQARSGSTISCPAGGNFGNGKIDGGQGEAVRVPLAGGTLVPVPGSGHPDAVLRSLLALSDVMSTGHHAATVAGVKKGDTVAVVGDGAVGLCAVLASKRLGAERVIALSRHPRRQEIAREFGASDVIEARGEEAIQAVLELTGGIGADAALECVGTAQSIATAFGVARPGSTVGIVGVPHGQVPFAETFFRNTGWRGGPAPARIYIPELLGDVLDGAINPGLVFDYETGLDHIADAYRAMDERRAIKVAGPPGDGLSAMGCEMKSTVGVLKDRVAGFEAQAGLAASTDFPPGE